LIKNILRLRHFTLFLLAAEVAETAEVMIIFDKIVR